MSDRNLRGQTGSLLSCGNDAAERYYARRMVLKNGLLLLAAGGIIAPGTAQAAAVGLPKSGTFDISFRNQHTGESFSGTYRVGNKYLPESFDRINEVLRDFRTNEIFPIDPRVIDILFMVREKSGIKGPVEILSGYRSPKTNARLSRVSTGVAKNSLHMTGQAIDFRLPGYSTGKANRIACNLRAGGVGYYPKSNFVHVDTGRVRHWS